MPEKTKIRGRGRPRTRPNGAKMRHWWATDDEFAAVATRAGNAGVTVQEYVRRVVLAAARGR